MQNFIFFTKTNWDETPRLRHQMAILLKDKGHKIIFFQKPNYFWQKKRNLKNDDLILERSTQLIHHQLRVFTILALINSWFEILSISWVLKKQNITDKDVVLNFNYDYIFLRKLFKKNKIINVINDDFVAQAKLLDGKHAYKALLETCLHGNSNLVVSFPLARQISRVCLPHLFYPWADSSYKKIERKCGCKKVLLWAHVDERIDFSLIDYAASKLNYLEFYIVGPISDKSLLNVEKIKNNRINAHFLGPMNLNDLHMENFFVSILPYKNGVKSTEAVTLANKSLQLMAKGLPLVTYGMPEFYEHPAISKAKNPDDFLDQILFFQKNINGLQAEIENFVNLNRGDARYEQLMKIVNYEK
jgi:hypothetical protein